jgi:transcriptional regulator with XRE-family HTH domain
MPTDEAKQALREERAARARAARAYADLSQSEVADKLGVSHITLKRIERATKDTSIDELHAIADVCGVPHAFMDDGFQTIPSVLEALHGRFDRLEAVLGMTAAQAIAGRALRILASDDEPDKPNGNGGQEGAHEGAPVEHTG